MTGRALRPLLGDSFLVPGSKLAKLTCPPPSFLPMSFNVPVVAPTFNLYFGNYLAILTNAIPKKVPQLLRGRIPVTPANHQFYVVPPVASTVFKVFWDFLGIIF